MCVTTSHVTSLVNDENFKRTVYNSNYCNLWKIALGIHTATQKNFNKIIFVIKKVHILEIK